MTAKSYPQTFFEPPPGACQILLVRHGQSAPFVESEPFPLVDGQGDPPLSPLGRYQAEQVGVRLATEPLNAIYVTSLQRTAQTAAPLAERLSMTPKVEADLREVHLGEGEGGRFRQMVAEEHPAVLAMRANQEWGEVPGAETNAQFQGRTVAGLKRIAAAHPNEFVMAVCHGGTIGALLGHATNTSPFTFNGSRNGSFAHLVIADDGWTVRSFNDASHCGPLTADADPPT